MHDQNTEPTGNRESLVQEKARLRKIGIIVLLIGCMSASLVYWLRTRSENSKVSEYEQALQRSESRQMELLYGKSGDLVADVFNALKRPGPQAATIAVVSVIIAGVCFYLGQPLNESDNAR